MLSSSPDWLGYLAAALTTTAFLPQVIKTWRTQTADDLSLAWLTTFSSGVFCWMLFGIAVHSTPIILANAVTFALAAVLGFLKLRFRR